MVAPLPDTVSDVTVAVVLTSATCPSVGCLGSKIVPVASVPAGFNVNTEPIEPTEANMVMLKPVVGACTLVTV